MLPPGGSHPNPSLLAAPILAPTPYKPREPEIDSPRAKLAKRHKGTLVACDTIKVHFQRGCACSPIWPVLGHSAGFWPPRRQQRAAGKSGHVCLCRARTKRD